MAGRRSTDKWTKLIQATTVFLFLVFVIVSAYGLNRMFNEIKEITKIQQELILNLSQENVKKTEQETKTEKVVDQFVSKVELIKYRNETDRKLKGLQKTVDRLKQKVKILKNPL